MTSETYLACKKVFLERCLKAVAFSVSTQYFLLAVFLLFVNFHPLHPISWITSTFWLVFSFYTWFCIMPLIAAVVFYGVLLGNAYFAPRKYFKSRFLWVWNTWTKKLILFSVHVTVGFLTAWLYSRFLSEEFRTLTFPCFEGSSCINSRYTFITLNGIFAGAYYFGKEFLRKEIDIVFPVIQVKRYIKVRSKLFSTLYNSLWKSFVPTICYTLLYWLFGGIINGKVSSVFGSQVDGELSSLYSIFSNVKLLLYVWILSSQILSNMYLIRCFFNMFLTETVEFSITNPLIVCNSNETSLLTEALGLESLPLGQLHAALDFYMIIKMKDSSRRQEMFTLSQPGNHPHNWNNLSAQCMSILCKFTDDLKNSTTKTSQMMPNYCTDNATLNAQKLLLRQYNQTCHIRRLMNDEPTTEPPAKPNENILEQLKQTMDIAFTNFYHSIPGFAYFFGEEDGSRTAFVICHSQNIIWITLGLAGLCEISITEDKYGVVQIALPKILKVLLTLKLELDKLNNASFTSNSKKLENSYVELRSAVKRSLVRICTVFGKYLQDIIEEPDDLHRLQCFVNYQEI